MKRERGRERERKKPVNQGQWIVGDGGRYHLEGHPLPYKYHTQGHWSSKIIEKYYGLENGILSGVFFNL